MSGVPKKSYLKGSPGSYPNQQTVDYPSFKLVIVGDGGTGKTTFVKRHLTGEFEKKNYWCNGSSVGFLCILWEKLLKNQIFQKYKLLGEEQPLFLYIYQGLFLKM